MSPHGLDEDAESAIEEQPKIEPREYQRRMCALARRKNVVICLDTGTGKTFISVMIMRSPEFENSVLKEGKRIVFLVPTEALLDQQADVIQRHTDYKVGTYFDGTHRGNVDIKRWDRNTWQEEIDRHHVLVMIYEVFNTALQHCMISLQRICLMIVDEAHWVGDSKSKHPCRKILQYYKHQKANGLLGEHPPRLVGLTAGIINWKPKKAYGLRQKIEAQIQEMISSYDDAVCETSGLGDSIETYAAKPEISIEVYDDTQPIHPKAKSIKGFFECLQPNVKEIESRFLASEVPTSSAFLSKILGNLATIFAEMGVWCGLHAIMYCSKDIREKSVMLRNILSTHSRLFGGIASILRIIGVKLNGWMEDLQFGDISLLLSPKMNCLLELLRRKNEENEASSRKLSCIIFVKQRAVTEILCFLLQKIAEFDRERYGFIRAGYVVGTASQRYAPHEIMGRVSLKAQKETLSRFRDEDLNIIVATSVLEEGLDVKSCNLVIRYDMPGTFNEFLQSRGRARAKPSFYHLMVPKSTQREDEEYVWILGETEKIMREICREQTARNYQDDVRPCNNSDDDPYTTATGAKVDLERAPALLNEYCQRLPSDTFTPLTPEYIEISTENGFLCEVRMPINCPIKEPIKGSPRSQKKTARKFAALMAIKRLHEIGELNDDLAPVSEEATVEKTLKDLGWDIDDSEQKQFFQDRKRRHEDINDPSRTADVAALPEMFEPGTKKRRQLYNKSYALAFRSIAPYDVTSGSATFYGYKILYQFNAQGDKSLSDFHHLGFITHKEIPPKCMAQFSVFNKIGEIVIDIVPLGQLQIQASMIEKLNEFNRFIYQDVLHLCTDEAVFDFCKSSIFLVVLDRSNQISWPQIDRLMRSGENCGRVIPLAGSIVLPTYRSEYRGYYVEQVCHNLNPLSPFPENEYKHYTAYYFRRHYKLIQDERQPLLKVRPLENFSQFNRLTPRERRTSPYEIHLVPSLCRVLPLSHALWLSLKSWPAIFHRINRFLLIEERILLKMLKESGVQIDGYEDRAFLWKPLKPSSGHEGQNHTTLQSKDVIFKAIRKYLKLDQGRIDNLDESVSSHSSSEAASSVNGCSELNLRPESSDTSSESDSLRNDFIQQSYVMEKIGFEWFTSAELEDVINKIKAIINVESLIELISRGEHPSTNNSHADNLQDLLQFYQPDVNPEFKLRDINMAVKPDEKYDFRIEMTPASSQKELMSMFVHALTAASASDAFNLERLETIGDSFLKFATSIALYLKCGHVHEGILTACRIKQISNFNLYRIAKKMDLGDLMVTDPFLPTTNWLPPGFDFKSLSSSELSPKKEMKEQLISDKSMADSIEALIGASLLSLGPKKTLKFMRWLGLYVFDPDNDIVSLPSPLNIPGDPSSIDRKLESLIVDLVDIEKVLGYQFSKKAYLLQAMTHPSFFQNRITDCYQRLEFLGDSVLDYLVTFHIYGKGQSLTPGQLTDFRAALVCNEMFAKFVVELDFHKKLKHMSPGLFYKIDAYAEKIREGKAGPHRAAWTNSLDVPEEMEVPKILGDIFESLAGAIFLDSGMNLDAVWEVFYRIMKPEIDLFMDPIEVPKPPVRLLWELFPDCKWSPARILSEKPMKIQVTLNVKINSKNCTIYGLGANKQAAKNDAAKKALDKLTSQC